MDCSTPGLPVHHQIKLMSIESVMPSSHLILFHPLLLLSSIFSSIRVFSSESVLCIRWSNYRSVSSSISPSNEYSGLIPFRMNWLDLFAVQGTLKSLPQHYSSKASVLLCSALFMVQLSHPYMTTGKTIALTRWTFVGKVMSLLFNMLSRLVLTFLPRSKHPLNKMASENIKMSNIIIIRDMEISTTMIHHFIPTRVTTATKNEKQISLRACRNWNCTFLVGM